jgi:hypothetical protein
MKTEAQWNNLRWRLEELADKEMQEQLWMGKIAGEMSTFDECQCGIFDDSGLSLAMEANEPVEGFTKEMRAAAENLERLLSKLPQTGNDLDALNSPKMPDVRLAAAAFLALLSTEEAL